MTRRLDRLQASNAPGLPRGVYTNQQRVCEQVETLFDSQQAQIDDIATALAAALAAQTTADGAKLTDKISGSSVIPANVLSATDAGSNATVTVAAHTRLYGDGTQLSVNSHNFTAKAYSTKYAVYYNDATCADTTPSYQITTTLSNALPNFASGRHFVGTITTPGSGGSATSGGVTPPGSDPGDRPDYTI